MNLEKKEIVNGYLFLLWQKDLALAKEIWKVSFRMLFKIS